jgi:KaiC/GvpD/RAD55 family RecA-like ATPase
LFDTQPSRTRAIWRFVSAGLDEGDTVVVVARAKHWRSAERMLRRGGWRIEREIADGRLIVLDADVMLASFMRKGSVDRQLFEQVLARCVSDLARRTRRRLRIYGEMVDLLAEEANMAAAQQLEELWNGLGRRFRFTLLCGYAAAHFTDPKTTAALRAICDAHTDVASAADDLLGNWILKESRGTAA